MRYCFKNYFYFRLWPEFTIMIQPCIIQILRLYKPREKDFSETQIKNSSDKCAKHTHLRNKSDERWSGRRFYDNEGSESIESSRGCKLKEGREVKGDISPGKELEGAFALPPIFKGGALLEDECKEIYVWVASKWGGRQEILGTPESGKEQVMRGDKGIFVPCDP